MFEISQSATFIKWLSGLNDIKAKSAIRARIERAKHQNDTIIFLLCGGDKSTQGADIQKARKIAKEL
jgi:putative component of toxin-antitoxin plasmid stabilization module